jgi:hypothetical protein
MKPSKDKARRPARQEFGALPRATAPARPARSRPLQRRPPELSDTTNIAAAHGENDDADREKPLPREDRAG